MALYMKEKRFSVREQAIQGKIMRHLEKIPNLVCFKVIGSSKRGCPDILVCYRGKFIGLEVKRCLKEYQGFGGKKTLKETQKQMQKTIRCAGGIAEFVDSISTANKALAKALGEDMENFGVSEVSES